MLTYNIAGLPDGFMTAHPSSNVPQVGPLLAGYDLALLQEDFAYGLLLRSRVTLAHQSPPFVMGGQRGLGDGLSQFSKFGFSDLERTPWQACHGLIDSYFDCLTPKGFTWSRLRLAEGVAVDVYNVHLDAGSSPADRKARALQIQQLTEAVMSHSAGQAVLLAGDTNIRAREGLVETLERATGLVDVCRKLQCPEPRRIDRVFFRDSGALSWAPRKWSLDRAFVDANHQPLSDHLAVAVELDWRSSVP